MLEASLCPVIAAAPGFMLLQGKPTRTTTKTARLCGWRLWRRGVDQHGIAYPVVAQEISDHIAVVAILQPDGQVVEFDSLGAVYNSEAEWLADVKEREDEADQNCRRKAMTGEHGEADAMTNDDILDELVDLPVCVHCKKPSTLKAQVVERSNRYCRYHAHTSCIERHKKAPPVKADLPQEPVRDPVLRRVSLNGTRWRANSTGFGQSAGQARIAPRPRWKKACEAANSLNWSYAQMTSDFPILH